MSRVFDCVTFFNETDLLELRIKELYDHVDFFVICEADRTFRGDVKPLNFEAAQDRLSPYVDKIRYFVIDDMPEGDDPWMREHHQRHAITRSLRSLGVQNDDMVMVCDVDEIVRHEVIKTLRSSDGFFKLNMSAYNFYMNYKVQDAVWSLPYASSWRVLKDCDNISILRGNYDYILDNGICEVSSIDDAGWHFTFLGGADRVRKKLMSYSHQEDYIQRLSKAGAAEKTLVLGIDIGGRKLTQYHPVDQTFPKTVYENLSYYEEIGFCLSPMSRIRMLEDALAQQLTEHQRFEVSNRSLLGKLSGISGAMQAMLTPYSTKQFRHVGFTPPNLIEGASDFGRHWIAGAQPIKSAASLDVPHLHFDTVVMKHFREKSAYRKDNNVGWFVIPVEKFDKGCNYVASCHVWIPEGSSIEGAYLDVTGFEHLGGTNRGPSQHGCWQKIVTRARYGDRADALKQKDPHFSVVLRVNGRDGGFFYSTAWDLRLEV